MLNRYGRALAWAVIIINAGFDRADPFVIWNYLAYNYGVDLDLNLIREAQKEAVTN